MLKYVLLLTVHIRMSLFLLMYNMYTVFIESICILCFLPSVQKIINRGLCVIRCADCGTGKEIHGVGPSVSKSGHTKTNAFFSYQEKGTMMLLVFEVCIQKQEKSKRNLRAYVQHHTQRATILIKIIEYWSMV